MSAFLLINPRAGDAAPSAEDLAAAARRRGVETFVLRRGDDAAEAAREAGADVLGVAGGDGSLAGVAAVALEQDKPFVCIPFGTRNHFARDVGLDRNDPLAALAAFDGDERRVDVGLVGDRIFLNNVSLGVYARLVHRRENHRRRRELAASGHALWLLLGERNATRFVIDGDPVSARVVLVANNAYQLGPLSVGERESIDTGLLHLYVARGLLPRSWDDRSAARFVITSDRTRLRAAIDGESDLLETPLEFTIAPQALRLLLPRAGAGQ